MVTAGLITHQPISIESMPGPIVNRSYRDETSAVDHFKHQLERCGYRELRSISFEYHDGMLILQGVVTSYYLKQVAQGLAHKVPNVRRVVDAVEVTLPIS